MHDLFDICPCSDDYQDETPHMPLIGDPAPEFTAMTTNGPINFPAKSPGNSSVAPSPEGYKEAVVLIESH